MKKKLHKNITYQSSRSIHTTGAFITQLFYGKSLQTVCFHSLLTTRSHKNPISTQIKFEKSKFERKYYKNLELESRIRYLLWMSIGIHANGDVLWLARVPQYRKSNNVELTKRLRVYLNWKTSFSFNEVHLDKRERMPKGYNGTWTAALVGFHGYERQFYALVT